MSLQISYQGAAHKLLTLTSKLSSDMVGALPKILTLSGQAMQSVTTMLFMSIRKAVLPGPVIVCELAFKLWSKSNQ